MTDRDGDVVQHYGYSPFGKDNGPDPTPAFSVSSRYTGQTLDEDTGLYYYGARYYDPELARFIQADSLVPGLGSQALNRYTYCFNNPLILTDPSGNNPTTIESASYDLYVGSAYTAAPMSSGLSPTVSLDTNTLVSAFTAYSGSYGTYGSYYSSGYGTYGSYHSSGYGTYASTAGHGYGGYNPGGRYGGLLQRQQSILNTPPGILNAEDMENLLPTGYDFRKAGFMDAGESSFTASVLAAAPSIPLVGSAYMLDEAILGVHADTLTLMGGGERIAYATSGIMRAGFEGYSALKAFTPAHRAFGGMRVWRAWGGKSQYGGTYYTNINPATMSKGAYFDAANLSGTGNTMGWINSGTITDLRGVTMGPVGGGSIMEVVIPNPATQVRIGALSQW